MFNHHKFQIQTYSAHNNNNPNNNNNNNNNSNNNSIIIRNQIMSRKSKNKN